MRKRLVPRCQPLSSYLLRHRESWALAKFLFHMDGQRQPVPRTQLAEVGIEQEVSLPAVFLAMVTFAGNQSLVELRKPWHERDTVIFQPGANVASVSGQRIVLQSSDLPRCLLSGHCGESGSQCHYYHRKRYLDGFSSHLGYFKMILLFVVLAH